MPRWKLNLEKHAPMAVLTRELEDMLEFKIDDELHTFEWHEGGIVYRRLDGVARDVWLLLPSQS